MRKNKFVGGYVILLCSFLTGILIFISNHQHSSTQQILQTQEEKQEAETKYITVKKEPEISAFETIKKRAGIAKKIKNIDIILPKKETFRLAGSNQKQLMYWLQTVNKKDRNKSMYIVLPKQGLVMPINTANSDSEDYKRYVEGEDIDFNKYLATGAFEVPGTSKNKYGQPGNKVISGHSSFYTNEPGRYKTHFQQIITMNPAEEIWIYQKNTTGTFDRFTYSVKKSYNTTSDDVSILKGTSNSTITLFTCTPIGGISGRWVVRGEFVKKD